MTPLSVLVALVILVIVLPMCRGMQAVYGQPMIFQDWECKVSLLAEVVFLASKRAGNIENTFNMPGYTRVDRMLKYQRKIGPSNMTVQFNIQNLLD